MKKLILNFMLGFMFILILSLFVNAQSYWVENFDDCPILYNSVYCNPASDRVCAINEFGNSKCTTSINLPDTPLPSNTIYGDINQGGFVKNCFSSPFETCNNVECNRATECFNLHKFTLCNNWASEDDAFECGDCLTNYCNEDGTCRLVNSDAGDNKVYTLLDNGDCGLACASGFCIDPDDENICIEIGSSAPEEGQNKIYTGTTNEVCDVICDNNHCIDPENSDNCIPFYNGENNTYYSGSQTDTCSPSCKNNYLSCDEENYVSKGIDEEPFGCNTQIGSTCESEEGYTGQWVSECNCNYEIEPFYPNILATGVISNKPFLWGNFTKIGPLITLFSSETSFIVNDTGVYFNNELLGSGGTTGESLWNKTGNDIYYNEGKVGIGTDLPEAKLHVNGNYNLNQEIVSNESEVTFFVSSSTQCFIDAHCEDGGYCLNGECNWYEEGEECSIDEECGDVSVCLYGGCYDIIEVYDCLYNDDKTGCEHYYQIHGCGEGTVLDIITGTCFMRDLYSVNMDWITAVNYCSNLELCNNGFYTTISNCNNHGGLNNSDWDLFTKGELLRIIDYSKLSSAVVGDDLFNTYGGHYHYWTRSKKTDDRAWYSLLGYGNFYSAPVNFDKRAVCVYRDEGLNPLFNSWRESKMEPHPDDDNAYAYIPNNGQFEVDGCGDGTVLDHQHGLCWKSSPLEPSSFFIVEQECNNLGDDWRLPTINEWLTLISDDCDEHCGDFISNLNGFNDFLNQIYWTGTLNINSDGAWVINNFVQSSLGFSSHYGVVCVSRSYNLNT